MQPGAHMQPGPVVRPIAEVLACPAPIASMLDSSAQFIEFHENDIIFRQKDPCRGLYIVVSGELLRKSDRLEARILLGQVRTGSLIELAAALGDGHHTYTLMARSSGSLMLLPIEPLNKAFRAHPPLRMQLLEELAREVSRAYTLCTSARLLEARRRPVKTS